MSISILLTYNLIREHSPFKPTSRPLRISVPIESNEHNTTSLVQRGSLSSPLSPHLIFWWPGGREAGGDLRRVVLVRPYFRGLAAAQAWSARRRPTGMPRSGWRQPHGDAARWSARWRPRGLSGRRRRRTTAGPQRCGGSCAVGLVALVLLLTANSHPRPPPLQRRALATALLVADEERADRQYFPKYRTSN
jgi:hypothetical protein